MTKQKDGPAPRQPSQQPFKIKNSEPYTSQHADYPELASKTKPITENSNTDNPKSSQQPAPKATWVRGDNNIAFQLSKLKISEHVDNRRRCRATLPLPADHEITKRDHTAQTELIFHIANQYAKQGLIVNSADFDRSMNAVDIFFTNETQALSSERVEVSYLNTKHKCKPHAKPLLRITICNASLVPESGIKAELEKYGRISGRGLEKVYFTNKKANNGSPVQRIFTGKYKLMLEPRVEVKDLPHNIKVGSEYLHLEFLGKHFRCKKCHQKHGYNDPCIEDNPDDENIDIPFASDDLQTVIDDDAYDYHFEKSLRNAPDWSDNSTVTQLDWSKEPGQTPLDAVTNNDDQEKMETSQGEGQDPPTPAPIKNIPPSEKSSKNTIDKTPSERTQIKTSELTRERSNLNTEDEEREQARTESDESIELQKKKERRQELKRQYLIEEEENENLKRIFENNQMIRKMKGLPDLIEQYGRNYDCYFQLEVITPKDRTSEEREEMKRLKQEKEKITEKLLAVKEQYDKDYPVNPHQKNKDPKENLKKVLNNKGLKTVEPRSKKIKK